MREPPGPMCYTLFLQAERQANLTVYVRTWMAPQTGANAIRAVAVRIDPKLIVDRVTTMTEQIDGTC